MELSGHEEDIPIPLNSSSAPTYGGGHHGHVHESHMIHHHHHHHSPNSAPPPPQNHILNLSSSIDHDNNNTVNQTQSASIVHSSSKKSVRYRECLKNHAASMGGNATDGCGEFIPNGEEGSIESLTCSACNCHRNFHRKEIDGEPINFLDNFNYHNINKFIRSKKLTLTHPTNTNNLYLPPPPLPQDHHHQLPLIGYPTSAIPSRGVSYNMGSILSDSDEHEDTNTNTNNIHLMTNRAQGVKKRFRTKFTQEQKEKMMQFAEKAGWKLQKQEESVVQQFCQEIGVKRRVLKVWMHNNKHNLAKKNLLSSTSNTT